jgi:hypothetical protein
VVRGPVLEARVGSGPVLVAREASEALVVRGLASEQGAWADTRTSD